MASMDGSGIEKGSGYNRLHKLRCPHCYSWKYLVVDAFIKDDKGKFATRQCRDCYTSWDVNCTEEYIEFRRKLIPNTILK